MLGLSQTGNQGLKTVGSPWRCWSPTAVRWVAAVVSVAAAAFVTLWLREAFQSTPNALFFCAIILSSRFGGLGPGLLAGVLSVLAIKYYSTPPLHTLAISINELPRFVVFLAAAVFISWVSGQQKQAEKALRKAHDDLERKVQARTVEFRKTNQELQAEVAERKRAETELRRTQTYLSEGQRLSHTGSWAWNVKTKENAFWSKEHFRIYGFDPETAGGDYRAARERIHPDDARMFDAALERAIRERSDFELHHRIILPGGVVRHIHALGHPVFDDSHELVEFIGTAMDITERKQSEALLSSEKRTLEMIARGAPLGDVLNDLCDAIDEQSSGSFSTVLSLDPEDQRLWPVAGPRIPQGWTEAVSPLVIGPCAGSCGTAAFRRETVVVSDIATDPLWAEFRATALSYGLKACWSKPVISTTGVVLGTFATYYDEVRTPDDRDLRLIERATHIAQIAIERDRTQDSLRKSQANLAHVTRVTTMGELTASIAHEVNQPLAGVVTNANACIRWLAGDSPDLHEAREALRRIVRDGNRASDVIGRIRGLLKKGEPARTRLDINPVIQETIELVRGEVLQRKVSLQTELAAGLPLVSADRVQLQQVLLNLITNALDALRLVKDRPRFLRIRTDKPDARAVRVAVQDTGVGVDPQQAEHLFQAFFTTKSNGLGMGLSISRSIVEAHGGRLWATPNDGPGVTFQFTLPVEEGAAG